MSYMNFIVDAINQCPDYIGKTYDKMIDSSEELAFAFSRKGMIQ